MSIDIGGISANCHFFVTSEIELDLNPKEIKGAAEHKSVLLFMAGIAESIGKPILLTPENDQNAPYLSYEPSRSVWQIYK